jgi:hypothetical protein
LKIFPSRRVFVIVEAIAEEKRIKVEVARRKRI